MKTYIGIDPGLKGGIAIIYPDTNHIVLYPMPVERNGGISPLEIRKILDSVCGSLFASIEKAQAMPRQGVKSMFNYGVGFGLVLATIKLCEVPYELITPHNWQKLVFGGTPPKIVPKDRASIIAHRLFPDVNFKATPRCKKDHDGMIDALLIAESARRRGL